jgi:hypothetical protein
MRGYQRRSFYQQLVGEGKRRACQLALGSLAYGLLGIGLGRAQQIPVVNPPAPGVKAVPPLQMERVEIHRLMGLPPHITRPPGPFVLLLVNETGNPRASFAVQSVGAPTPLLVFDAHTPEVGHRRAGLLNGAKGQYQLKSLDTGRVLCTITIQ